ncbi:sodium:solute symporter family protein [Salinicoccus halitifaciens]|uniref:SSS family solute:Na+ symporter n=1 Tax=Salinicoccus halitifaciens TaxID=1073415 RepID=A0ABV2EDH6_9STAP|nr:sodium:solute symporter family protein [Salinicoccus halitifaciens]MCD2138741.1 sodium:solute symporter family protein [Salinicoccus halitifaciens]
MAWYILYFTLYFGAMIGVAWYYFFKIKTYEDYMISSWSTGFWRITGTIISTNAGAAVFIGWVGLGFTVGLSGFVQFAMVAYIFSLILVIFFAKPLRRQKLFTLADLFTSRFGGKAGIIPSILSAFIYSVPTLALQLIGMSTVFTIAFDWNQATGMIVGTVLILAFSILGGLPATIITDAVQSILILLGLIVLSVTIVMHVGGFGALIENTEWEFLSPINVDGISGTLLYALSVGPFYLVWQSTWQRIFAAKDEKTALRAGITGHVIVMVISFLPFLIGVSARQFVDLSMEQDLVFSYVTNELLPAPVAGLIFVALLAALMTGATSFNLQGASNLTRDMYQVLFNPKASNKQLLRVSRITVIFITLLGLGAAFFITNINDAYRWALMVNGVMLVFPFLAIMFWPRVTKKGAITSMLGSLIVVLIYPYLGLPFDQALVGYTLSFLLVVIVSLLTKHDASEVPMAAIKYKLDDYRKGE